MAYYFKLYFATRIAFYVIDMVALEKLNENSFASFSLHHLAGLHGHTKRNITGHKL